MPDAVWRALPKIPNPPTACNNDKKKFTIITSQRSSLPYHKEESDDGNRSGGPGHDVCSKVFQHVSSNANFLPVRALSKLNIPLRGCEPHRRVRVQERVPTHSTVPWPHSTVHQAPGPGRGVLLVNRSRENGQI